MENQGRWLLGPFLLFSYLRIIVSLALIIVSGWYVLSGSALIVRVACAIIAMGIVVGLLFHLVFMGPTLISGYMQLAQQTPFWLVLPYGLGLGILLWKTSTAYSILIAVLGLPILLSSWAVISGYRLAKTKPDAFDSPEQ